MRSSSITVGLAALLLSCAALAVDRANIPGSVFASVLPPAPGVKQVRVAAFAMDRVPVTNAQFARFVRQQPQWQRGRVVSLFADERYLQHWRTATRPAPGSEAQPVTQVSWFAASAYCSAQGARLPTWYEWELVAAASQTMRDARSDAVWRQHILDWYARSARDVLPDVGATLPNVYGVHDVHGVVWEWVEDLSAMLVSSDNRQQGDPDVLRFCGTGALTLEQKENYAMLMRIAMLSSMQARYTSATMGFRCVSSGNNTP